MTASTATTQPPDKCPACKSEKMPKSNDIDTWYECAQLYQLVDGVWKPNAEWSCNRSFSAAIALRAERDALKSHAYVWAGSNPFTGEQVLQLLNENDAARARVGELQAVVDAAYGKDAK